MCLLCWIIFTPSLTIATATCWISYFQPLIEKRREGKRIALRREKQKQHEADLERRVAAGEFQMYLQQFEHLAKTAAELLPVSQDKHGFSKFGGLPLVPSCFRWPRHNDEPRQFVAQFDFAEINTLKFSCFFFGAFMFCHFYTEIVSTAHIFHTF